MSGTKKTLSTSIKVIIIIGCVIAGIAVGAICTAYVMNVMQEKSSSGADNGGSVASVGGAGADNGGSANVGGSNTGADNGGSANVGGSNTGADNGGSANSGGNDTGAANSGSANVGGNNAGAGNSGSGAADTNTYIGIDQAKANALADAGVTAAEVTYTKAEFDYEDGEPVYEIEFYTSEKEYEYEIHAQTGSVYSRDVDVLPAGLGAGNGGSGAAGRNDTVAGNGGGNDSGAGNIGNGGGNNGSGTGAGNSGNGTADASTYIGIDQAKELAAEHVGLSVSDVVFSKAELDYDDGLAIYEIEFYKGRAEYEYEINAVTGDILEYDWD